MTEEEFDRAYDNLELEDRYAEYIMEHSCGDRLICNGDTLIKAMEDGYLFDDFREQCLTNG